MGFKIIEQGRGYKVVDTLPNRDGGEVVRFTSYSMLSRQVRVAEQYAKGHGGMMKPSGIPLLRLAFGYYQRDKDLSDANHCRRVDALFAKWDRHRDTTPIIPVVPIPPGHDCVPVVPTVPEPASIAGLAFGALVVGVVAFRKRRIR